MTALRKMMIDNRNEPITETLKTGYIIVDDIIPAFEDELSIKKFQIKAQKTAIGISIELFRGGKKITQTILQANGIATLCHNGKVIAVFTSGTDIRHRLYEVLKAMTDMSRFDEDSEIGRNLAVYLQENKITLNDLTFHYTPIMLPNLLKKSQYLSFLTELKKLFIMKFEPVLNTAFQDEFLDMSEAA